MCIRDRYINEYIDLYKTVDEDNDTAKAIAELEKKISFEQKKKAKLLDYNINGDISDQDYIKMNNEAIKKIEAAEAEKAELENKLSSETEFKKQLEEIRRQLEKAKEEDVYKRQAIRTASDQARSVSAEIPKLFCTMELLAASDPVSVEISDGTLFSPFFSMKLKYDCTDQKEEVISWLNLKETAKSYTDAQCACKR